jgi:peptidoglycan-N-acetylglucosamine deacetylase
MNFRNFKKRIERSWEFRYYGGVVNRFKTTENVIALTFDDGPHPEWTLSILDLLEKYEAKATFFVIGQNAVKYPSVIKKITDSGHAIGNHSWSHPSFTRIHSRERFEQLEKCEKLIKSYNHEKLFRPPFGHLDKQSRREILRDGYTIITWNVVPRDWEKELTLNAMYDMIKKKIEPGCIILMHDTLSTDFESDRTRTLALAEIILKKFGNEYRFMSIPEIMKESSQNKCFWEYDDPEFG